MATTTDATPPPAPLGGLDAISCGSCHTVSVPLQGFGCETCGAYGDMLTTVSLTGYGEVLSAVSVNQAPAPPVPVPYVVAVIQLKEGPVVRALVGEPEPPAPGSAVLGGIESVNGADFVVFHIKERV